MTDAAPDAEPVSPRGEDFPWLAGRGARWGFLFWILFSIVAVLVRGVRWDEQLEFAQVVTRSLPYPDGHPFFLCTRNALNAQIYGTSLLWWLTSSPVIVCGVRNVLVLLATVLPAYLFGVFFSRRALFGHVAVALALLGFHLSFAGCYPMVTWGGFFSTGPVGMGYALIVLFLIVSGWRRAGGFLLGVMPCVHIGQMPILLGLTGLRVLVAWCQGRRREARQTVLWTLIGLAVCGVFLLAVSPFKVTPPATGPYFSTADPKPIWEAVVASDPHRAAPGGAVFYGNSQFVLAAALLLVGAAAWREFRRQQDRNVWNWAFMYVLLCTGTIELVMVLHVILGSRIPYVLIAWMPYRLSNHVAVILVAALVGMLADGSTRRTDRVRSGQILCIGALSFALVRPVLEALLSDRVYHRYIASGDGVLFGLCGVACALLAAEIKEDRRFFRPWLGVCFGGLVLLGFHHQFGAFCAACGLLAGLGLPVLVRQFRDLEARTWTWAVGVTCALAVGMLLFQQYSERQWLPRSRFDTECIACMAGRGDAEAMVVSRPDQYLLQSRLSHPVMVDLALVPWIPYMPSVGPAIEKIHNDLYGITVLQEPRSVSRPDWIEVWSARTDSEWNALSKQYYFRYVVSPNTVPLRLPECVKGASETLYEVPADHSWASPR